MKRILLLLAAATLLITAGCSAAPPQNNAAAGSYTQISQEKAMEMMAKDDGHIIVDVRRQDEYEAGHIPGAILIPNESIDKERPEELPDLGQIILIYCRSGNRSKQASQKLAGMGYANIYEFGGILDWTGDIVTGTGPETAAKPVPTLVIKTENGVFYAALEDNPSAEAFIEKLSEGEITVAAHDYGGFEKVGTLPWTLPRSDTEITTVPGDIILYQGDQITVYYGANTWNFTKLAHIDSVTREELLNALGSGDAEITFYIEWSE